MNKLTALGSALFSVHVVDTDDFLYQTSVQGFMAQYGLGGDDASKEGRDSLQFRSRLIDRWLSDGTTRGWTLRLSIGMGFNIRPPEGC